MRLSKYLVWELRFLPLTCASVDSTQSRSLFRKCCSGMVCFWHVPPGHHGCVNAVVDCWAGWMHVRILGGDICRVVRLKTQSFIKLSKLTIRLRKFASTCNSPGGLSDWVQTGWNMRRATLNDRVWIFHYFVTILNRDKMILNISTRNFNYSSSIPAPLNPPPHSHNNLLLSSAKITFLFILIATRKKREFSSSIFFPT